MDTFSPEIRSKTMRAVRSTKTKLEDSVSKELWRRGLRFRRNVSNLPGKPDIAIKSKKFVMFIDSCFWHGCPEHCRLPSSNKEYWEKKIAKNSERDTVITSYYVNRNWNIMRVWEHDIKSKFNETITNILNKISHLY